MIIYSLVCNDGGMLRVVESLENLFDSLPPSFPLKIFIFSKKMPERLQAPRFVWFHFDTHSKTEWPKVLAATKIRIHEYLGSQKIDWIIADFMTLSFFEDIDARICYDVHFLGRPFFKALSETKGVALMDDFHRNNFVLGLQLNHFTFLKNEFGFMKKATRFITNSASSERHLRETYRDVTSDKDITYVPVSSYLESIETKYSTTPGDVYFHGRFHPQKGIHFLFDQDWHDLPLTLRGFENALLTPDRLAWLKSKGITAIPWTGESATIRQEILAHKAILFPSIYEPWGLSLQEALSLGQICIANVCQGGHEEQIEDGVNGFLIDFSQKDFKNRIHEILKMDQQKLDEIRSNAKIRSKLGHQERIQTLKDMLQTLI